MKYCQYKSRNCAVLASLFFLAFLISRGVDAKIFPVTNTLSSGTGSFKMAIDSSDRDGALDTVYFNIAGSGPHTINMSQSEIIDKPVLIDGYSQPGSSPNTLTIGNNAVMKIILYGSGSKLTLKTGITLRGLVINGFGGGSEGIRIDGSNCVIEGNFIGTDVSGLTIVPNNGVAINIRQDSNTVGGGTPGKRNVIAGSTGHAIFVPNSVKGTLILGNYIGTDKNGENDLGNGGSGIFFSGNATGTIGGSTISSRNVISNNQYGIWIDNTATNPSTTYILGNYVGTNATGSAALGNDLAGIHIEASDRHIVVLGGSSAGQGNVISSNGANGIELIGADSISILGNLIGVNAGATGTLGNIGYGIYSTSRWTMIGGVTQGDGNIIGGNALDGIRLQSGEESYVRGNFVGTDPLGNFDLGNSGNGIHVRSDRTLIGGFELNQANVVKFNGLSGITVSNGAGWVDISRNCVTNNGTLGIDLDGDGITPNDADDHDNGTNGLLNFPILTSAYTDISGTTVEGTYDGDNNLSFLIQLFSNSECDSSGNGEGAVFLDTFTVTTNQQGTVSFEHLLPSPVSCCQFVTALATAHEGGGKIDSATSEFSNCIPIQDTQSDQDNDGINDAFDNCPLIANTTQDDLDGDEVGNACDNCPNYANTIQSDLDSDGKGDACDALINIAEPFTSFIDGVTNFNLKVGAGIGLVDLDLSRNSGQTWDRIATALGDGWYSWSPVTGPATGLAKFRILENSGNKSVLDEMSFTFVINNPPVSFDAFDHRGTAARPISPVIVTTTTTKYKRTNPDSVYAFDYVVVSEPGVVEVFRGFSDGTLDTLPTQSFVTDTASDMVCEDFNRDGFFDLAIVHPGVNKISLHFGQLSGLYSNEPDDTVSVPNGPASLLTADWNSDSWQDLCVATSSPCSLRILHGSVSGFVPQSPSISSAGTVSDLVLADFNKDSKLDIAVASGNPSTISVLAGDGTGGFASLPGLTRTTSNQISRLLAYDFDHLRGTDLGVVYDSGVSSATLLMNNNGASFDSVSVSTLIDGHSDIVASDFSGNGIVDLIITSSLHDSVIVVPGFNDINGGVGFCCPYFAVTDSIPIRMNIFDANGDGKVDLFVLNYGSATIQQFSGTLPPELPVTVTVVSPNGSEQMETGTLQTISWSKGTGVLAVDVQLSRDGGTTWETIADNQYGTSCTWQVTPAATSDAIIRITDCAVPLRTDFSNAPFTISLPCCQGLRGNANGDLNGTVNVVDITYLVQFLFLGGNPPPCPDEADANGNGSINVVDLTYLVAYLFQGGALPAVCP